MNKISHYTLILFLGAFLLFFSACADDPLKVGLEVLPEIDQLNAQADTLPLSCYTMRGIGGYASSPFSTTTTISVQTKLADYAPIGHVIDPIFGQTWSEPVIEIAYNSDDYYSHDSIVEGDEYLSCKLYLKIKDGDVFGGTTSKFDVDLFPLTKYLLYYNYSTNYVLGSEQFEYNHSVSVNTEHNVILSNDDVSGLDTGNYVVITLDPEYAKALMNEDLISDDDIYNANFYFLKKFPGFYLRTHAVDGSGAIKNFQYYSSEMVLEYNRTLKTEANADTVVKKSATFSIAQYQCLHKFIYNDAPVKSVIEDTLTQYSDFYVQSMGGLRGFVKIEGLDNFRIEKKSKIGINLAELVFPVDPEQADTVNFLFPTRLMVEYFSGSTVGTSTGRDDNIGPAYYNGFFDKEKLEYRINITDFVHTYVQGYHNFNSFYLSGAVADLATTTRAEYKKPGRAVLNSGIGSKPAFLRIIYTSTDL